MRTIGFRSNVLVAIAAACGVIAALGRPWYGTVRLPATERATMEDLLGGIGRALLEHERDDRLGRARGRARPA